MNEALSVQAKLTNPQVNPSARGDSPLVFSEDRGWSHCRTIAWWSAVLTAGAGLLALFGWAIHEKLLASWHPNYVPMAPATCIAFLLLAFSTYQLRPIAVRTLHRGTALIAALIASIWGVGKVAVFIREVALGSDRIPAGSPGSGPGSYPEGIMSPLTAVSFLLAGLALVLIAWGIHRRRPVLVPVLTGLILLLNTWVLLGYLDMGQLKFYEHVRIPVAIPTAVAFLILGVGIIAAEGPQSALVHPFIGHSTRATLLRAFLPATATVVLLSDVLRSTVFSNLLLDLALLFSTAWTMISTAIVCLIVLHVARKLGGRMDRMEAERQKALEELRIARDAAQAANETKSQFLANMSHELRTPLNGIIGYSELLEEEAADLGQDDFLPDLRKINAAGKHLLGLINDILDLSKIEAGKVELTSETFGIPAMIKDVVTTIQPVIGKKNNVLHLDVDPRIGDMTTDVFRLRQCLFNLLSNAGKFTENGTITLRARREAREDQNWILFSVQDTGIGMTEEQRGRLFQAFMQADASTTRKFGGTGLGLTISLKLSQMMGGTITVDSEPNVGSPFTLHLPALMSQQSSSSVPVEPLPITSPMKVLPEPSPIVTPRTVLVVDDDPQAREILDRFLTSRGFHVVTVARSEDALPLAKELHPDAITLDVQMPGMDGWSVLSALKSDPEVGDIPTIMLTIVDNASLGMELGADEYLTKPVNRNHLLSILKSHCEVNGLQGALVVEDDASNRELLRRILEKDGWKVREASNGIEGLEQVAKQPPALILLDLMMPQMDGFQMLDSLSSSPVGKSIPVIVITARDLSPLDRARLETSEPEGGAQLILQKGSFTPDDLLRQARHLVSGNSETAETSVRATERPPIQQPGNSQKAGDSRLTSHHRSGT